MARKTGDRHRDRLEALIEEATADCYDEAEAFQGFVNMIEENVRCPFRAKVLGEDVEVVELRSPEAGFGVFAVCRYKGRDYNIDINSIDWPKKKPVGFKWIEAYQSWLRRIG